MSGIVSIVTPPQSAALTALATAKLDLALTDTTDDAYVVSLIARASGVITAWIGRPLGLQTVTETFRREFGHNYAQPYPAGYGGSSAYRVNPLVLTYVPVTSVSSIMEDGTALTAGTDFEIDPGAGLAWRLSSGVRISWLGQVTVVSYSGGYVLPNDTGTRTLPAEIEDVCLTLTRAAYYARGADPAIIVEQVEGVGRNQYGSRSGTGRPLSPMELDPNIRSVLASYRQYVF